MHKHSSIQTKCINKCKETCLVIAVKLVIQGRFSISVFESCTSVLHCFFQEHLSYPPCLSLTDLVITNMPAMLVKQLLFLVASFPFVGLSVSSELKNYFPRICLMDGESYGNCISLTFDHWRFFVEGIWTNLPKYLLHLGDKMIRFQDNGVTGQVYMVMTTDILIAYELRYLRELNQNLLNTSHTWAMKWLDFEG